MVGTSNHWRQRSEPPPYTLGPQVFSRSAAENLAAWYNRTGSGFATYRWEPVRVGWWRWELIGRRRFNAPSH